MLLDMICYVPWQCFSRMKKFTKALHNSPKLKSSPAERDDFLKFHFHIHRTHLVVPLTWVEITHRYPRKAVSRPQCFPFLSVEELEGNWPSAPFLSPSESLPFDCVYQSYQSDCKDINIWGWAPER